MSLQPGTTIGPYTIVSKLGEGGMGEVYRATDSRLGRDVALKVLPDDVAGDQDRRARFEREAKALAALNHFNIAQVYGFEDRAIVMELLVGETLRDRLNAGQLPIRKASDYGIHIARGLAAAHERGIIHRDLKPENIFIVTDGHAKILDFGLAREAVREESGQTMTREGTSPGVVMGTAGYMSPEQVRGAAVDSRSDVFALGVVLFEMLTGAQAFRRESTADTLSAILNDDPAGVSSVRAEIPPAVDRIVLHCLEKRPAERFQSARDVAFALEALSGSASSIREVAAPAARRNTERALWIATTLALAMLVAWSSLRPEEASSTLPAVSRTQLPLPPGVRLSETVFPVARMAISQDGTRVALTGLDQETGRQQIYIQPLDGGEARVLENSLGANVVAWSTDSRYLTLFNNGRLLRVSLDGGVMTSLADNIIFPQRSLWDPSGLILIGGGDIRGVSAQGGSLKTVRAAKAGERYQGAQLMPDGRHILASVIEGNSETSIRISSLDSAEERELLRGADLHGFAYAPGALLFARGQTLYAQRLDTSSFELQGRAVVLAEHIESAPRRGSAFSVSDNGTLVYQRSASAENAMLTWFDRSGRQLSTIGEPSDFTNLELSSDGRRLLASATDLRLSTRDQFIIDVTRGIKQRFSFDPSDERSAVWTAGDRRVIYTSRGLDLYSRAADLSGDEQDVIKDGVSKDPNDVSQDGRWLLYRRSGGASGNDLYIAPLQGGASRPIAATRFNEASGMFSPDGRWVVYQSDESGQAEVYAVRVEGGGKIQISSNGGLAPRWRGDGREIVYLASGRELMSVPVRSTSGELEFDAPKRLFELTPIVSPGPVYDITADGSRFIVASRATAQVIPMLTVLQNWTRLLDRQ
ncbi:MAG: protein kinase domain-containing protein [Acidimicrobiia bacterium]